MVDLFHLTYNVAKLQLLYDLTNNSTSFDFCWRMIHDRRSENRQQEEIPLDFHAGPKAHGNEMLLQWPVPHLILLKIRIFIVFCSFHYMNLTSALQNTCPDSRPVMRLAESIWQTSTTCYENSCTCRYLPVFVFAISFVIFKLYMCMVLLSFFC